MRNGRQNAVGDSRTQKSDDHAQPLRPLADGTQSGDDEPRWETVIEKKQSAPIIVIGAHNLTVCSSKKADKAQK